MENKHDFVEENGKDPSETGFGVIWVPSEEVDQESNSCSIKERSESADDDDRLVDILRAVAAVSEAP